MKEQFDSNEEMYFFWWLLELKEKGFIKEIELQPTAFPLSSSISCEYEQQMKTKSKIVSEEIMKGHVYTTDVFVIWNKNAIDKFTTLIDSGIRKKERSSLQFIISQEKGGVIYSFIEVKPSFDQNNMTRLAVINQKWVWEKFKTYVNIVIPEKHFNKTFTPGRYFFTNKSKVPRTIKYKSVLTLSEFLKSKNILEGFEEKDDNALNQLF